MRIGCLVLSIAGLLCGLTMLTPVFSKEGQFNSLTVYPTGILLLVICGIYIIWFIVKQSQAQQMKQQLQQEVMQPPPEQTSPPQEQPRKRQWTVDE